jgi:hypothetical protein
MLYKIMFFADAFEASKLSIQSARVRIPPSHKYSADLIDILRWSALSSCCCSHTDRRLPHC